MNIYLINRQASYMGPFDIIGSNREHILNVGDVCLRETVDGIAFLYVYRTDNTWGSCLCVGIGPKNNKLIGLEESLLYSYDGIHRRQGDISLIKKLLPCFREKVIIDFLKNAIDILEFKKDVWDVRLFQDFFSPVKELVSQKDTEEVEVKSNPDQVKPEPSNVVVKEVKAGDNSTILINPSSNKKTRKLFKQYHKGDKTAFDELIKENLYLVHSIVRSFLNKGAEYDDLVQEGTIGLIKAIECFDLNRYVPFPMYAKWWIVQALIESIKTLPYTVKLPPAHISLYFKVRKNIEQYEQKHGYEPSPSEINIEENVDPEVLAFVSSLPDDLTKLVSRMDNWEDYPGEFSSDDILMKESRTHFVNDIIGKLTIREADILRSVFGIGKKAETLEEIGERLFLSRERVRQIKEKAIRNLKEILNVTKAGKKDDSDDDEDELTIEEIARKKSALKIIDKITKKNDNQTSNTFQYNQFKIINTDNGVEIRDYYNSLVFSTKGYVKSIDGILYCLRLQALHFSIYQLKKSGYDFKIGELVINAPKTSKLYQLLDINKYFDQIESIRRNHQNSTNEIRVGGFWYSEAGNPIKVENSKLPQKYDLVIDDKKQKKVCAEVGSVIKYDSKICTVIEKKSGRLIVKYKSNGTLDNIKDDKERYVVISKVDPQKENKSLEATEVTQESFNIDFSKIERVFDKKATSYKYFWFMAIISLAKEKGEIELPYKDILIRMATLAWPIVMNDGIDLGKNDLIAKYLNDIQKKSYLINNASIVVVESYLRENYDAKDIGKILSPLLKNVPYRFLSPWIKYTTDEEVVKKSLEKSSQGFYELHEDRIIINKVWWNYIIEHYNKVCDFALQSFISYVKQNNKSVKLLKLMTLGWLGKR